MREDCFYIDMQNICDDKIVIKGEEHEHLYKVLRHRVGDKVKCFYNSSKFFHCEIVFIDKVSTTLKILNSTDCLANPKINFTLFQALPKLDKLEIIAQKLTELGATKIVPFSSTFCIKKDNPNKIERLKKIIINACKQCGRTKLLQIENSLTFKQMLECLKEYDLILFANEVSGSVRLKDVKFENSKNIAVIVGSEGGFSKEEVDKIVSCNAISLTLGKRILRAETCAICLSSAVLLNLEN